LRLQMRRFRHAAWLAISAIAILANGNAHPQSRPEVLFTNRIVTFTNLQGQVTVDANLIRATTDEVIFKTNDDYGTVMFTNLAPQVLEYLGVPQSHLKLVREQQAQLAEQAARELELLKDELAKLDDPANLVKVNIQSVVWTDYDALYGSVQRCNVSMPDGEDALVYVARLPATIPDYLNRKQPLEQTIAQLTDQIATGKAQVTNDTTLVNQAKHEKGARGVVRADIRAAEDNLLTAKNQLNAWNSQLKQLQTEMAAMEKMEASGTSVLVLPSHFKHNGSPLMICSTNQVQETAKRKKPK